MHTPVSEGWVEGRQALILRQLGRKLGSLPEAVQGHVVALSLSLLELSDALLDFATLSGLTAWLQLGHQNRVGIDPFDLWADLWISSWPRRLGVGYTTEVSAVSAPCSKNPKPSSTLSKGQKDDSETTSNTHRSEGKSELSPRCIMGYLTTNTILLDAVC
jgi:hypothetical protein